MDYVMFKLNTSGQLMIRSNAIYEAIAKSLNPCEITKLAAANDKRILVLAMKAYELFN